MKLISRKEWGARQPDYRYTAELSKPSTGHWNGPTVLVSGKTTWDHKFCASLVRGIQNFHMDSRDWSDIAYNFVVCPHGCVFEGRGLNVINGANGTNLGNKTSHAVMVLAGTDNSFPDDEKIAFRECVAYISEKTNAPDDAIGHRDHKSTECPGDNRYRWIHDGMPTKTIAQISEQKEKTMNAAIELIKVHYRNARGVDYDVSVSDIGGWQYWLDMLLDAYDKGQPLKAITDQCGGLLFVELSNRG